LSSVTVALYCTRGKEKGKGPKDIDNHSHSRYDGVRLMSRADQRSHGGAPGPGHQAGRSGELVGEWDKQITDFRQKAGDKLKMEVSLVRFMPGSSSTTPTKPAKEKPRSWRRNGPTTRCGRTCPSSRTERRTRWTTSSGTPLAETKGSSDYRKPLGLVAHRGGLVS